MDDKAENKASAPSTRARKTPAKKAARPKLNRKLTPEQRAEAVALWRAGSVTLEDLSKTYGKRPENFGRLFRSMGIAKGSAVAETEKKVAEAATAAAVSSVTKELERIATMKNQHYQMSSALAKIAFAEITRARQGGLKLESLRETMLTLKLAGEIVGNARKDLYALLNVEEHDKAKELDGLPELEVRELSQAQILEMQNAAVPGEIEDLGFDDDVIEGDEDDQEGL